MLLSGNGDRLFVGYIVVGNIDLYCLFRNVVFVRSSRDFLRSRQHGVGIFFEHDVSKTKHRKSKEIETKQQLKGKTLNSNEMETKQPLK